MRTSQILLGVLAATLASAADPTTTTGAASEPASSCLSAASAFLDAVTGSDPMPTMGLDLAGWYATATFASTETNICAVGPSVTDPALASDFTSFSSGIMSWQTAHMSELRGFWQGCKDDSVMADQMSSIVGYAGACVTDIAAITATGSVAATGGAAATRSGNAGPRETGMVVAAAAAAGFAFAAVQ